MTAPGQPRTPAGGPPDPHAHWLVTGSRGQLGTDLQRELAGAASVTAVDLDELDITDPVAVGDFINGWAADHTGGERMLVNAAAWTAVDAAEGDEAAAARVNAEAPGHLARACAATGTGLVHVSTDYVFSGDRPAGPDGARRPWDEDDEPDPRSAYGRTKLAGERAVLQALPAAYVVRTAWVYGAGGSNFVKTMCRLERERETVSVVDDQRGSPTWSLHLAQGLVRLADSGAAPGVYHCTGGGDCTWWGLTRAIFTELGADPSRVEATTTDAFPRPAPRPAYSVLGRRRWEAAGLPPMPHWRDALHQALADPVVGPALRGETLTAE